MKLFNAIAAAAVIGASLITATPAEASRDGWIYVTDQDGATNYMRYVGRSGNIVTVLSKWSDDSRAYTWKYNCSSWMKQIEGDSWKPIYPRSVAETKAIKAC